MSNLLWILVVLILLAWVGGFALNVGSLIHLLLVLAVIIVLFNLITGRRATSGL
jgi:hypothetical protein